MCCIFPNTTGKRWVLLVTLILSICSLACLFIAFVTPYWFISWPRVYSPFRRIGLWEVCFNGQQLMRDPSLKSYYGCWWILAPEFYNIRDWVMPPWFIIVQILITISLVIEVICVIFLILVWIRTSSYDREKLGKRRPQYNLVQASTIIIIGTAVSKAISVIMFGLGAEFDINWMPHPEINYPHFSYGLAIVSCFFSIFGSMSMRVYRGIVRTEYQQPADHA